MKKFLCLAAGLLALHLTPGFAQPMPPPASSTFQDRLQKIIDKQNSSASQSPALTKFNLDFPGGTAKQLVAAIEKALGKPLNVIVPTDEKTAKVMLPPIKVTDMDVARLFKALEENKYGGHNDAEIVKRTVFFTEDGNPSDNSLWKFSYFEKPPTLTAFSLDFPGGTPAQLVKAIEKAIGKPLNVIINKEDENVDLPALKMSDVYLPQLFSALETASRKTIAVSNPGSYVGSYSQFSAGFGFKTADTVTDTSVWYFHVEKPSLPPVISTQKVVHYYSLAQYLDRGFTVDDITTAIQTGWKMSSETSLPELNYHKETKMLIAYGEPDKLKTIAEVLNTLPQSSINVATAKEYDNYIEHLKSQVKELKDKMDAKPASAGTATDTRTEKTGQ